MAHVTRNPDNTLTVTLTQPEQRALQRWATERSLPPAAIFEEVVNGFLQNKINDYRALDGPSLQARYDALTPAQQAQVDAVLGPKG